MISVRISFHFLFSLEVDHFTLFELYAAFKWYSFLERLEANENRTHITDDWCPARVWARA